MISVPVTPNLPKNQAAFLATIAFSEGTSTIPDSDGGYRVIVGSTPKNPHLFASYAEHPFSTPGAVPIETAYGPSTASGAFQIIRGMASIYSQRLSLPDFSPLSQDAIALQMLRERGVLALLDQGLFQQAVAAASPVWASLPGSRAGQRTQALAGLVHAYQTAGGALA